MEKTKTDILALANEYAHEALENHKDLSTLDTKFFLSQSERIAKSINDSLSERIKEDDSLSTQGFSQETISIISIYSMFEAMSQIDETGITVKKLLKFSNLFMFLFQSFKIANQKYGQSCSVDDNIWIYEFVVKVTDMFNLIGNKISAKEFLSHKNVFIILLGIMNQNFIEHVEALPSIKIGDSVEGIEKEIQKVKKEYSNNIRTIKSKILSIADSKSADAGSIDFSAINEMILETLANLEESLVKNSSEQTEKIQNTFSEQLNKAFENIACFSDEDKKELKESIAEIVENALEKSNQTLIEQIQTKPNQEMSTSTVFDDNLSVLDEVDEALKSNEEFHKTSSEDFSTGMNSADIEQLKEDLVSSVKDVVGFIMEEQVASLNDVASNIKQSINLLKEGFEKLNKETDSIRLMVSKVEEISKSVSLSNENNEKIIKMLEEQNENSKNTLERIKNNDY